MILILKPISIITTLHMPIWFSLCWSYYADYRYADSHYFDSRYANSYYDFSLCANSFIQLAILITPILVMQVSIMSILVMPFLTMPIRFMLILLFSRLELVLSILVPGTNLSKTCSPLS